LHDGGEAEDAAQQTFLSAHRALLNGATPREPAAWLATIARNECWARISARMREPLPAVPAAPPTADPVQEALRRADLAALWQAILALPRGQRDALLLREFGGLSYEELAAALAVSEPAVESLLFRARRSLRARLRTARAAAGGLSWIEALGRLVAGGGAPAAAKVAALGVGAAALGSGAVVVPRVFDNHQPSRAPVVVYRRHTVAKRTPKPAPVLVAKVASPPAPAPAAAPPPPGRLSPQPAPVRHEDARRTERRSETRSSDDGRAETRDREDRSAGSGSAQTTTATIPQAPAPTPTLDGSTTVSGGDLTSGGGGSRDGGDGGTSIDDGGSSDDGGT
jgi:RNA polymerase sigma factor (sigma-70 family)